ncbi:hypothetical protein ACVDG8_002475 [Mesorhizobium sp. ORM8.1]
MQRAFSGSVLFTDKLSIVAGVFVPAAFEFAGKPVTEAVQGYVAAFIVLAVGGGIVLRLLTAPYFIWKEDQGRISALQSALDAPAQRQREKLAELIAQERIKTVEVITRVRRTIINFEKTQEEKRLAFHGAEIQSDKFFHDPMFAQAWYDFYDACNLAYSEWQDAQGEDPTGEARRKFNRARGLVDACASALTDYLLIEKPPELSPEDRQALSAPRNAEAKRIAPQ